MANSFDVPSDSGIYEMAWEPRLQTRLNKPENWKEIADVRFTTAYTVNFPYMSTEFVAQTGTRGTAYGFSDFTLTNEALTISTFKIVPVFIDRADLAQQSYVDQMEIADRQARLLSDQVESALLADYGAWTDVGDSSGVITSGVTTPITISATNIDDVVRGVRGIIMAANGTTLAKQNGIFFLWRAADFVLLEQYAQNNGFNLADAALKNGLDAGYFLFGAYHYVSNSHTAGHVYAGVRKVTKIGVLSSTWGKIVVNQDPAAGASTYGPLSGVSVVSRADFGIKTPTGLATLVYDVNVS